MFTSVKAAKACEQIVQQIEQVISAGTLAVGSRLPSERALAKEFGVSRMTVRRAIQALESVGLVDIRSGRGTFVSQRYAAPALVVDINENQDSRIGQGR